ncbi:hypothetical protein HNQ94_000011 [Salirhabdus euzebyi]|uniref:Uncharacterized protein n=1 Tax=Salirhabdus euzebyi TaxID=394506 RepID=A0A841PS17_9BACI|nr:hypothetical protein [Salirhabdus euzebyi]MBB6451590.1 hypothetical protein [Salirhabdus euzebyi]
MNRRSYTLLIALLIFLTACGDQTANQEDLQDGQQAGNESSIKTDDKSGMGKMNEIEPTILGSTMKVFSDLVVEERDNDILIHNEDLSINLSIEPFKKELYEEKMQAFDVPSIEGVSSLDEDEVDLDVNLRYYFTYPENNEIIHKIILAGIKQDYLATIILPDNIGEEEILAQHYAMLNSIADLTMDEAITLNDGCKPEQKENELIVCHDGELTSYSATLVSTAITASFRQGQLSEEEENKRHEISLMVPNDFDTLVPKNDLNIGNIGLEMPFGVDDYYHASITVGMMTPDKYKSYASLMYEEGGREPEFIDLNDYPGMEDYSYGLRQVWGENGESYYIFIKPYEKDGIAEHLNVRISLKGRAFSDKQFFEKVVAIASTIQ